MKALLILAAFVALVAADCYMQNPSGSNDRNQEANTNRNNANRLFDSQNNAKGGYCRGPSMSFYAGSLLNVEWTAQHGCGRNPALMCQMILQYMCSKSDADPMYLVRDGTTTDTITDDVTGPTTTDPNTPGTLLYGMHEPYDYYQMCKGRDRNRGLFIADREQEGGLNAGRRSAIYTRQNNNGNRHGYECTEERDYYPYWGPSPWIDIAILAQNIDHCDTYRAESQNVKPRGYCLKSPTDTSNNQANDNKFARYLDETSCLATKADPTLQYEWVNVPAWGVAAPDCVQAPFTRENHLGNSFGGFESSYNWTIPSFAPTNWSDPSGSDCVADSNCNCVLRIRYNISTSDGSTETNWEDFSAPVPTIGAEKNGDLSPIKEDPIVSLDGLRVELAIDTTQFGRTFQDRTHMFHILPRPSGVAATTRIHNLNVKGKRGNIVQTYPATEYAFAPQFLDVVVGDYVHFQWTGCDQNPAGNAGEGQDGTDRSNIMQMKDYAKSKPLTDEQIAAMDPADVMFPDVDMRKFFTYNDQDPSKCATGDNVNQNDPTNCYKLNMASQKFDAGLVAMNSTSEYFYMASRNNNFSNRGHKAVLRVNPIIDDWAVGVVVAGAAVFLGAGVIGGMILYAKTHPHSGASALVSRL